MSHCQSFQRFFSTYTKRRLDFGAIARLAGSWIGFFQVIVVAVEAIAGAKLFNTGFPSYAVLGRQALAFIFINNDQSALC